MALEKRIVHIKRKEANNRLNFGQEVNVTNKADDPTLCPSCEYDEQYRKSKDPNCTTCGGTGWVYTETTYNELVLVKWITELEQYEREAGNLKIGDCILTARIESKSYFDNALKHEIRIEIDPLGTSVTPIEDAVEIVPATVTVTDLKTQIKVYCNRVTPEN